MVENKTKNLCAYCRVSTKVQSRSGTIENQEESIKNFIKGKSGSFKVLKWYRDDGVSAYKDRPQYDKMLSDLDKYDGIVAQRLDRVGRSVRDISNFIDFLESKDKVFLLSEQPIDTSTTIGKTVVQLLSVIAEFEHELIEERVKEGRRRYIEAGGKLGRSKKEVPDKLKDKMIHWYKIQKNGVKRISDLIQVENISKYPSWFQREYIGFGKLTDEEKQKGLKRFYMSPATILKRLKEWNVEVRSIYEEDE